MQTQLRQRHRAIKQVENITFRIGEEHRTISLALLRLAQERHYFLLQLLVCSVEVRNRQSEMPESWSLHTLRRSVSFRVNDLNHRPVRSLHEYGVGRAIIHDEAEYVHVPFGESSGIGRRDSGVFDSLDHDIHFNMTMMIAALKADPQR